MKAVIEKAEAKKPSIRFVPKLRQYESGVEYMQGNGIRIKISLKGYIAPTMEDERRILRMMESDPFCGVTTWENREMPQEQKAAEGESRVLRAENVAMKSEMNALKEEMARLSALVKKSAGE